MFRKRHPPVGSKPGTLMIHSHAQRPVIRVMRYKLDHLEEHDIVAVAELKDLLEENTVCWIDVQGLGDEKVLRELADLFSIHLLALEDVVNVPQRPKIERFEQHTLCITRMALLRDEGIEPEQVSLFVGPNYVLTFQERSGDVFDPIRNRIRKEGRFFVAPGPVISRMRCWTQSSTGTIRFWRRLARSSRRSRTGSPPTHNQRSCTKFTRPNAICWRCVGDLATARGDQHSDS